MPQLGPQHLLRQVAFTRTQAAKRMALTAASMVGLLLLVSACGSSSSRQEHEASESVARSWGEDSEAAAATRVAGGARAPLLERQCAFPPLAPAHEQSIEASARAQEGAHTYVAVPIRVPDLLFARVEGPVYGFVATHVDDTLLVRLVTDSALETLRVQIYQQAGSQTASSILSLEVRGLAGAPHDPGLPERFRAAASRYLAKSSARTPFHVFAAARLDAERRLSASQRRPTDLEGLMDLYTGMHSIELALQSDRGLRVGAQATYEVPIASLSGPELSEHPWEQMLAERGTAMAEVSVEAMARVVPDDVIYMHFNDLRDFVNLVGDLDAWISPVSQAIEQRPGHAHFIEAYERQLAIERSGLAERFGHLAAKNVAIVLGDPFIREGSDVSLLFHVANREVLDAALSRYQNSAQRRRPDAGQVVLKVGSYEVSLFSTPDGEIRRYRLDLPEVVVLSNSLGGIARFVAVAEGRHRALSDAPDFRYMRAIYPAGADEEDGFLFIGDALVARAVSPATRILEARRMQAKADILAVNHAALLFGWLEGRVPEGVEELVASGLLEADELRHVDGSPIAFEPRRGASSAWGRAASLTPMADLAIDQVSAAEAEAYADFRRAYERHWREMIDPIAVRVRRTHDGRALEFDARMLPLLFGSDYDELIEMVGSRYVSPPTQAGSAQWMLAIGEDARLRRELNGLVQGISRRRDLHFDWLGDWAMFGVVDDGSLWDMALALELVPESQTRHASFFSPEQLPVVQRFPLYAAIHVKQRLVLVGALSALKALVDSAAPGTVQWGEEEAYGDHPVVAVSAEGLTLRYALLPDVFLLSFDRRTLELLIDAHLAGQSPGIASEARPGTQSSVSLRPAQGGRSFLVEVALGVLEQSVLGANHEAMAHYEVLARGLPGRFDAGSQRELALSYLGLVPSAAHDAALALDEHGLVSHPLYGSLLTPRLPEVSELDSSLSRALRAIEALSMEIAFEGEGISRGLHVRFEWLRQP